MTIPSSSITPVGPGSVRVADPVLTNLALGYSQTDFAGVSLFPRVPVTLRAGKIIQFGIEGFRLYNTKRAPGGAIQRVRFGYSAGDYSLDQDAIAADVPVEIASEAQAAHGIDLGQGAVSLTQEVLGQIQEYDHATLATSAGNYDANHKVAYTTASSWWVSTSKPLTDIAEGREAVRRSCGRYPNTLVLSPDAWSAARIHPQVLARFPNTDGVITLEQFARLVEIETVKVATRTYWDDAQDGFVDMWGSHAVMAWVNPTASNPGTKPGLFQRAMPSFGYTYVLANGEVVEQPFYDQNTRSWIYPNIREQKPYLTGMLAGFLLHGAGAK